jgi:hypothetical protein
MRTLRWLGPWALRAYIVYSVCLYIAVIAGLGWWAFIK